MTAVGLGTAVLASACAQSVTTDPVGYITYSLGQGTQYRGISLVNPSVFTGTVASVSGGTITVAGTGVNVGGNLTAGAAYYLEVTADPANTFVGDRFDLDTAATIAAANASLVTGASPENTLSALPAQLVGVKFVVRPHVTLGKLVQACPGLFLNGDQLFVRKNGTTIQSFTFNGTNWRQGLTVADGVIVYPGVGFALLRSGATATSGVLVGAVRTNDFVQPIRAGEQILGEGFPVDASPKPANPGPTDPTRLFTNDQGATTFVSGDRLYAYSPTTGQLVGFTYSGSTNKWMAGLTNGNTLKLFNATNGSYLISAGANNSYVYLRPFSL